MGLRGVQQIRRGCEEVKNTTFDPISTLPITNMRSGFTYKNYFCAICNNQTFEDRMEMWKPRLECPALTSRDNHITGDIDDHLVYRPDEGNWGVMTDRGQNQAWSACLVDPVVPESVEYLVRFCKPSIKDCPEGYNNTDVHRKCLSYTGTVYHLTEGYRNVHCAICNGILPENLMCDQHGYLRKAYQYEFDQAAFSLLFDLNPESGLNVGKIEKCGRDEIFDPFFKKCRAILCHPGQFYKDGQCITTATTSTTSSVGDKNDLSADDSNVQEQQSKNPKSPRNKFETCVKVVLESNEYEVLQNGTIYVRPYDVLLSKREYAMQANNRLVVCTQASTYYVDKFGPVAGYMSFAGVLVSIICIIAHLVACCLVPELRSLSGKNLASLCVALLVIYSMFLGMPFVQIPSSSCTVIAVILYYSFMAAFCWMLVLAWDVSTTLRKATQELRVSSGAQWTRFFFYSAFGWLFPALLVAVAVVAEFMPADIMPWPYSPNFGKVNCWFGQKPALLIYFAGPVGFILLLNLVLFIDSARLIASTTMGTAKAKACGPSHQNFKLYLRLALLMGISWILGIVAGYVDMPALWIVFIFFNTLQGLFIFLGFTCSTKARKVLLAKLCCASKSVNASWTWSGIGGNNVGTSSSSANTKRSELDGKDGDHLSLPSHHHHHAQRHNHIHHHGPSSLHSVGGGGNNGSASLGSVGSMSLEKTSSKMYRTSSTELFGHRI
ncbi:unnamed protein product [Allacma fusca]|uniref:G-protein coupled receptors family 2 profile 2 domain-containing protein n=1 Tax=Allacma fusca TaxID=39272 RepID=A0A8J2JYP7_9HEXA|nr:unnamed protein product [Allacma fusca]